MSEKQQRLVLSIIEFLNQSIQDGTVKQDDKESLEVAVQCIGEAFGVDPTDEQQTERLSVKPASLQSIFDVYLKTRDKVGSSATASSSAAPASSLSPSQAKTVSAGDKAAAEKLKQSGNAQMSAKQYDQAIESYTKAIALDPTNAVYYSNRAAAYSSKSDHDSAVKDAEKAIEVDPTFVKAYHRLGHAQYSLGDFISATNAFRRGLELDPSNVNLKSGLQNAEARIIPNDDTPPPLVPDGPPSGAPNAGAGGLGGMADMLRGMGGGGGGMPDLSSMMNNPMFMQMAQQLMANGGMDQMMQNPAVANMMNRVQSGGGLPSMDELMNDPSMRDLASQFGGTGR